MKFKTSLSALFFMLLCSCSTGQPVRTPFITPDLVQAVSQDMIVGRWAVRILNPLEGEPASGGVVEYKSDGTVFAQSASNSAGVDMQFEMNGTWATEGEMVRATMESIRETTGNPVAQLMLSLLDSLKETHSGTANILEASQNRLVLVANDGGQAQELTRIQ